MREGDGLSRRGFVSGCVGAMGKRSFPATVFTLRDTGSCFMPSAYHAEPIPDSPTSRSTMTPTFTITRGDHHAPDDRKTDAAGPVVTDGAWGTQLQQRGLPVGACPDAWNLTQPEKVEEVARAYVEAGSQVILTNTFGANRFILARHGLADQVAEINRAGRGHFAAGGGGPGRGVRLGRAQRRDADDGRGERGRR